jgi:diadenosine tetraphosphate (Ap4A) HIT family hydrolase
MVVSKLHVENASSLSLDAWQQLTRTWHCVERALLAVTGADRAIMMKLGLQTPHLHLHLYPVTAAWTREDVFDAIGGKKQEPEDVPFVTRLREHLTLACR